MTPSETTALIQALRDNASRLGLIWTLRYGTVLAVNGAIVRVTLDGDDNDSKRSTSSGGAAGAAGAHVQANSLIGAVLPTSRVAVASVPNLSSSSTDHLAHYVIGQIKNASAGRRLLSITEADASNDLTLGTSPADVPGCTVTATMPIAGWYKATGVYDFQYTASGNAIAQGFLSVDGANQTAEAHLDGGGTTTIRATVPQQWTGTLTAGAHTLKLQAQKSAALATLRSRLTHTVLVVELWVPDWL